MRVGLHGARSLVWPTAVPKRRWVRRAAAGCGWVGGDLYNTWRQEKHSGCQAYHDACNML